MSLDIYLEHRRIVYSDNITHNLGPTAQEAGIYQHLWNPDELGITQAHELITPLMDGLAKLTSDPEHYQKLNPSNGWGDYFALVEFVTAYLKACIKLPETYIVVSR